MARRRAADQIWMIDARRMLEKLAHATLPMVAVSHGDTALGTWTPERDPTLLWVSGAHVWSTLSGARSPVGLTGRRLSVVNPGVAEALGPELDRLVGTRSGSPVRARSGWVRPNGTAVWTDDV